LRDHALHGVTRAVVPHATSLAHAIEQSGLARGRVHGRTPLVHGFSHHRASDTPALSGKFQQTAHSGAGADSGARASRPLWAPPRRWRHGNNCAAGHFRHRKNAGGADFFLRRQARAAWRSVTRVRAVRAGPGRPFASALAGRAAAARSRFATRNPLRAACPAPAEFAGPSFPSRVNFR
jgi:hypothetical protein